MRLRKEHKQGKLSLGQLGKGTLALIREHGDEIVRTAHSVPSLKLEDMMKDWRTNAQNIWAAMDYLGVYKDWKNSRKRTALYELEQKYPELKEFCEVGFTLQELAGYYGKKKQGIQHICRVLGYDVERKKVRGEIKIAKREEARDRGEKGRVLAFVAGEIERIAMEKAGTEAERGALKYHFKRKNSGYEEIPFERVVKLFELYYSYKAQGKKVGFHTLAKEAGISSAPRAREILRDTGEKSLVYTQSEKCSRRRFREVDKKKMVVAVKNKGILSLGDLVEITGFAKFSLYHHAKEVGISSDDCRGWGIPCGGANIGYSKAMRFYRALDGKESVEEAGKIAGIKKKGILQRLVDKREIVERTYLENRKRVEEAMAAVGD